ncbi:hypothetical protein ACHAW5_003472 [Stephanodiscus triporus]|uniref:Uncharacterized protein n=1 Tax=Stephanodiscus triporus TaxID=2934178 RepID=A0ABD3MNB8_9STRA
MVDLFGGAIVASIPSTWRDVSLVRQEVYQDCAEETGSVCVIEILEYQAQVENVDACSFFLKDLGSSDSSDDDDYDDDDEEDYDEDHLEGEEKEKEGAGERRRRRRRRRRTIVHESRVIDLLRRDDDDDDDGRETGWGRWIFREFALPPPDVDSATTGVGVAKSCSIVACVARGSREEEEAGSARSGGRGSVVDDDDEDDRSRWIDIEMCVLRLEGVGADVLITLSVPRGVGRGASPEEEGDGPFRRILETFDVKDWGLFGC